MTIDPVVRGVGETFASSEALFELVQAMVIAEGGNEAFIKAVQCSDPSVQTFEAAVRVGYRSAIHRMADYVKDNCARSYVTYFGNNFWAPLGAGNDPTNLNRNWPGNVANSWLA